MGISTSTQETASTSSSSTPTSTVPASPELTPVLPPARTASAQSRAQMTAEPKGNAALDRSFLEADLEELLRQLSLEEKISLLAGKNWWE